jgi:hypothetical protein
MPWFAVHAIMHHELTDGGPQESYLVYENVYLIEGADRKHAQEQAKVIAKEDETDCSGTLTINERPGRLVFSGIRKVVSVLHAPGSKNVASGDEVTYSEYEVADREQLQRLVEGEEVSILYWSVD